MTLRAAEAVGAGEWRRAYALLRRSGILTTATVKRHRKEMCSCAMRSVLMTELGRAILDCGVYIPKHHPLGMALSQARRKHLEVKAGWRPTQLMLAS